MAKWMRELVLGQIRRILEGVSVPDEDLRRRKRRIQA